MKLLEQGIDVSYHQGRIDWRKVKQSGKAAFAIIRCGFRGYGNGKLSLDTQFHNNMKGAADNGIPVGVYFFSTAITVAEAEEEARYTLQQIAKYNVTYPVVFDYEGYQDRRYRSYGKTTKALRTAMCRAFCDIVTAAGYTTLIYGSQGIIRSKFDLAALPYDVWCARYAGGYTKVVTDEKWFPNLGEFTGKVAVWQNTSIGRVSGINGNVDLDRVYRKISVDLKQEDGNTAEPPSATYYPAYKGKTTTLSPALKSLGINSTYTFRRKIAAANGITGYIGTAKQNTQMYNLLKAGKLRRVESGADVAYYPAYTGKTTTLAPALKSLGINSSYEFRAKIAAANGISGYKGTANQNTQMYNLLKAGKLKRA